MAQAPINDKELLAALVADINAGKYPQLAKCEAVANEIDTELFAQNPDGFTACVPIGFIKAYDAHTVANELRAQLGAWVDMGTLWAAEPANRLIH